MHRLFSLTFFLFLPFLICATASAQTAKITTVSGEEYRGEVLQETSDTITIQTSSGVAVKIPRSAIRLMDYSYSAEEESRKGYWSFGGFFGTPGGLNIDLERNFNRNWGVSIALGLIPQSIAGLEFNFRRRIGGSGSLTHNVELGLGSVYIDYSYRTAQDFTYLKGGYNLNWGGFHLDLGLGAGQGTFPNPQLLLQIGYVHQFR